MHTEVQKKKSIRIGSIVKWRDNLMNVPNNPRPRLGDGPFPVRAIRNQPMICRSPYDLCDIGRHHPSCGIPTPRPQEVLINSPAGQAWVPTTWLSAS